MFMQFSPVRTEKKPKPVEKEDEPEKLEVLSLAPFTPNPKLFFEDIKVGVTASRKLLIENPTNHDVNLSISNNIPEDLNVTLNWVEATIERNKNTVLQLTWCPLRQEASRHVITIEDGKKIRRDVPIAFKSVTPKKLKAGTKAKAKPHTTSRKQTSPVKRKSPIKRLSPTKKYYSTKPSRISPKQFSPSQKHHSSTLHKYSPSPKKRSPPAKFTLQKSSPSPKMQRLISYYSESPFTNKGKMRERKLSTYQIDGKENLPQFLLNSSLDSNVFVSPGSTTFHLDYLQPSEERRETYVVKGTKDKSPSDCAFNDSLEASSPNVSPLIKSVYSSEQEPSRVFGKRLPLGMSNRDNFSPSVYEFMQEKFAELPPNHTFEYKLQQLDSFCFTPASTPVKQTENLDPSWPPSIGKTPLMKNTPERTVFENQTFEVLKSPNISTETYIKSNLSTETYIKGNASFETYVKGNISGGTYTKDSSIGDVANLSISPISSKISVSPGITKVTHNSNQPCVIRSHSLTGDNAKNVIEANLWPGMRNQPLSSIQEESYMQQSGCENDDDISHKSFLKRKSHFNTSCSPSKRANVTGTPKEWSKRGAPAIRIAKRSSGLNLKQFFKDKSVAEGGKEVTAVLAKKDTNTLIIQNPFILAATNLVDPFMTSNLYISEEWLDQQEVDFKKWLNALLTPPAELSSTEQVMDVVKVWKECKKKEVEAAPTKEIVSSNYHTNNKLNSLRRSAQNLFRTDEMSAVLSKAVLAVEAGRLAIRDDKDIHLNLALKSEVMSLLLSYNPLWLRIGLETIYNEIIPLKSNSDQIGLSTFIANRVLKDPYLLKKHKIPHSPKYIAEFKKFFLKKFLVLVYFLDQAKVKKLIPHDPCLFCKAAPVKESREMLIRLAREMLAAVGDITKYLKHIGYVVTHVQTYIHEFDYAVNSLGVDLRDGVRLTRLMEIILMRDDLTSNLRVPAISRLQKIHNMKIVFDSLEKAGYKILYDISPKDIVDSHKEKTLSFLWQIIYKFEAPLMVKSATSIQTWFRSLPVVLKRNKLKRQRLERESAATKIQAWYRRQKLAKKLTVFVSMLKKYLELMRAKRAAVRIQSYYRMYRSKRVYTTQHETILNIQRFARGWLVRNVLRKRIEKAIILQKSARMYLARKQYLRLKNATGVIQARYRAKKLMMKSKTEYNQLKTHVVFVQRRFRANRLSTRDKNSYQELKSATICIQQRYRAMKLCRIERRRYLEVRSAVVRIQSWYQSIRAMSICRNQFLTLKKAVIVIEKRYLALKAMKVQRSDYQTLRRACVTVQRRYRALQEMKVKRREYLELRAASVVLQRRYRARKIMEREKQHFETLKSHTAFVQRTFRANRAMKIARSRYLSVRAAAVKIQTWYRATREMRQCRTQYVSLKYAVTIFEDRYKANRLMRIQRGNYQRLKSAAVVVQRRYRALVVMRETRAEYCSLKSAAIYVQQKFRANKVAKVQERHYLSLKQAALVVQNRYRAQRSMQKARREYIMLKTTTVTIQRRFRGNVLMKEAKVFYQNLLKHTIIVQRRFRANKAMAVDRERYKKLKGATICFQQRWRAKKLGETQKQKYESMRRSALVIQQNWRARQGRAKYVALRKAAIVIQTKWRAKKLGEKVQNDYIRLRNAAVILQTRWRAKRLGEEQRKVYNKLVGSVVFIQRKWRANKLAKQERTKYRALKEAATLIQVKWKAKKVGDEERCNYLRVKNAALVLQRRWRARKLGRQQKEAYNALRKFTLFVQRQWTANKLAKQERTKYRALKEAARFVQSKWRAKKVCAKERCNFLRLKNAALVLQCRWRARKLGRQQKEAYNALRKSTLFVQRKWTANKLAKQERTKYRALKEAASFVQSKWRANKIGAKERRNYLRLKNSALVLQRRWRARKLGRQEKEAYNALRKSTIFTQRIWTANKLAKQERTKYKALKEAATLVQTRWRSKKKGGKDRYNYLQLKNAAVVLQQRWRARKLGQQQMETYNALRKSTIAIQRRWRANKSAKQERTKYQALKKAVVFTQSKWRGKTERIRYLLLRNAAVVLQQRWRARKLCREQKYSYELLRKTTIYIQRRWTLKILAKQARQKYEQIRKSVVVIQRKWRANKVRREYLSLKSAAIVIQQRWRAKIACSQQKQRYERLRTVTIFVQRRWRLNRLGKRDKNNYEKLRTAAITVQRRWRALKLTQTTVQWYNSLKSSTIAIQRQFRKQTLMKRERRWYTKIRTSVMVIQRFYRGYLMMKREQQELAAKRKAVLVLQKYIRGFLVRRKYADYFTPEARQQRKIERMEKQAAIKIQAIWRGYRSRSLDTAELIKIRLRARKANVKAEPHNTLGSRCKVALQTLVNDKSTLFVINKALEDLDFITRHSKVISAQVAQYLPEQIYLMIKHTNRSLPEMNSCIFSVHILINLFKYRPTRHHSFVPSYMDNIIQTLLHWCDKEAQVFPSMCTLLWLFAHNPNWKEVIRSVANAEQRLMKIQTLVQRKESMVRRTGVKGQSFFVGYKNLPLPSLEPDWGLEYKHKPYIFTNSVHGIHSLLRILNL